MRKIITTLVGLIVLWGSYEANAQTCIGQQNFSDVGPFNCGPIEGLAADINGSENGVDYC